MHKDIRECAEAEEKSRVDLRILKAHHETEIARLEADNCSTIASGSDMKVDPRNETVLKSFMEPPRVPEGTQHRAPVLRTVEPRTVGANVTYAHDSASPILVPRLPVAIDLLLPPVNTDEAVKRFLQQVPRSDEPQPRGSKEKSLCPDLRPNGQQVLIESDIMQSLATNLCPGLSLPRISPVIFDAELINYQSFISNSK